jgi:hypothetical protein
MQPRGTRAASTVAALYFQLPPKNLLENSNCIENFNKCMGEGTTKIQIPHQ